MLNSPTASKNRPSNTKRASNNKRARRLAEIANGVLALVAFALVALVVIVVLLSDSAPAVARKVKAFLLDVGMAFERAFGGGLV